jgi:hypothetical protein
LESRTPVPTPKQADLGREHPDWDHERRFRLPNKQIWVENSQIRIKNALFRLESEQIWVKIGQIRPYKE